MSFSSKFGTLFHKSDGTLSKINSDDGLRIYTYDSKLHIKSSSLISSDNLSFIDYYFDIKNNNDIYGLISYERKKLTYVYINNKIIFKKILFDTIADVDEFIKFPYIKIINNRFHVFYFLINSKSLNCKLIHKYFFHNSWTTKEIDCFKFEILTNFSVIFTDSNINIFYFKLVDNAEELFMCSLNLETFLWSTPYQITHSKNKKIYLSVINDYAENTYHIAYSENVNNHYYCKYIKGYTHENNFRILNTTFIQKSVACLFPNIIKYNNILNIQWLEYKRLYSSLSQNSGVNWSASSIDILSVDTPFSLYFYRSNYANDLTNIFPSIFICEDSFKMLGIRYVYFE